VELTYFPPDEDPGVTADVVAVATVSLQGFAVAYLDLAADDVAPADRRRLAAAAMLVSLALDCLNEEDEAVELAEGLAR
jgi:hypothetical protein